MFIKPKSLLFYFMIVLMSSTAWSQDSLKIKQFDSQDSFGSAGDAVKAKHSGYTFASEYAMGSITVGAGYAHQELVRGTRAQARATTLTAADAGNVREDTLTYVGIGYNMGGGVNTYIQLNNMNHSDGDHATTEADPQVLFAGISLGF